MFQGKETTVFRGNRILVVLFVVVAVGLSLLAELLWHRVATWLTALVGLIALALAAPVVSLISWGVRIFADGLTVTGILEENEIGWIRWRACTLRLFDSGSMAFPL